MSPSQKRSKGIDEQTSCTGKVGFTGYKLAAAVVNRVQTKERPGRSAYQCGYCGLWHIGSDKGHGGRKKSAAYREQRNHD